MPARQRSFGRITLRRSANAEKSRLEGRRPEALAEDAAEPRDSKPGELDHAAVQVAVGERRAEELVVVGVGVVVAVDEPDFSEGEDGCEFEFEGSLGLDVAKQEDRFVR